MDEMTIMSYLKNDFVHKLDAFMYMKIVDDDHYVNYQVRKDLNLYRMTSAARHYRLPNLIISTAYSSSSGQ